MERENGPIDESAELLVRLRRGDQSALASLFMRCRDRLRRMDRRLTGRIDPSDVLQEAYLDASRQLNGYLNREPMPLFIWLRLLTGQRLMAMHRWLSPSSESPGKPHGCSPSLDPSHPELHHHFPFRLRAPPLRSIPALAFGGTLI